MFKQPFNLNVPPRPSDDDLQLFIPVDTYSPSEIVVVQIDSSYHFPDYNNNSNTYILGLKKDSGPVDFNANSRITIILYDFYQEVILESRRGQVVLNQIVSSHILPTTKVIETIDSSAWRGIALVSSVEGPFQGGVLVNKLDLEKRAYYLAVPNSNDVLDSQLLSIKWEYQYNNGEFTKFKNATRSIVVENGKKKCKIDCQFHSRKDIHEVSMFAFFKTRNANVKKKTSTKTGSSTNEEPVIREENPTQVSSWHDPVDNPMCTLYMQSGGGGEFGKHWGLFGKTRNGGTHQGLDLFAITGTKIYACVDGTVYNRQWHGGYGNTITIKVKDPKAFLARKRDYKLQFERAGEIKQGTSWSENGNIYLFYAHLHSVNEFDFGDEVVSGQVLGTTGRSGVTGGTSAPHLHFEIFSDYTMAVGTKFRINPAFFVNYKGFDQQSKEEKSLQEKEKSRGKINQINGETKLEFKTMPGFKK